MTPSRRPALAAVLLLLTGLGHAACGLSVQGVAFGSYDPFSPANLDSAGNLAVSCDVPYTLTLSSGQGSYTGRLMQNLSDTLAYNLYLDPARTTVWGDGSGGSSSVSAAAGDRNHPVYGRIPARQNVSVGSYSDTIIVTLSF